MPAPRFNLLGPDQLLEPVPPPRYIVPGLVPEGAITIFYGQSGSFKTWLVMALVMSLATSRNFAGFPVQPRKVVILDFEMGPQLLKHRLQQLSKPLEPIDRLEIQADSLPSLYANTREFLEALHALESETVVVVDSFAAACPGLNENDASVRMSVDAMRRVAAERKLTLLIIHHAGKNGMLRGSNALEQAADEIVLVEKTGADTMTAKATKGRLAPVGRVLGFGLVQLDDGVSLERVDVDAAKVDLGSAWPTEEVFKFIRNNPGCSKRDIRDHFNHDVADTAVARLLARQRIENRGGASKHCYYGVEGEQPPPGPHASRPRRGRGGTDEAVPGVPVPPIRGARWGTPPGGRTAQPAAAPMPGGVSPPASGDNR